MEQDTLSSSLWKMAGIESAIASALFGIFYPLEFFFESFLNVKPSRLVSVTIFIISLIILFFLTLFLGIVRRSLLERKRAAEERKRISIVKDIRDTLMDEVRGLTGSLDRLTNELYIELAHYEDCIRNNKQYNQLGWKSLASICEIICKQSDVAMRDAIGNMVRMMANSPEFESAMLLRNITLSGVTNINRILGTPTKSLKLLWKAKVIADDVREVHLEQLKSFVVKM